MPVCMYIYMLTNNTHENNNRNSMLVRLKFHSVAKVYILPRAARILKIHAQAGVALGL